LNYQSVILIVDFGSQVTQLIARRIRELNIYSEICDCDISDENFENYLKASGKNLSGIILSGGPQSVSSFLDEKKYTKFFFNKVPVLGICFGMQIMTKIFGGTIKLSENREFGYAVVRARGHSKLFDGIEDRRNAKGHGLLDVWMSHGDSVDQLPENFKIIGSSKNCPIAAIANENESFYGLQFHPEVTQTRRGSEILKRFSLQICKAKNNWTMKNFYELSISSIRTTVGKKRVILGLSGGVDSSVLAVLIHRAIGDQLTCIFIDHGMLRLNEADEVMEYVSEDLKIKTIKIFAKDLFLNALKGLSDPENKRKVIGKTFIDIFQREANKIENVEFLAQGTIYPDVIESAGGVSKSAKKIKSHHNVGGLPDILHLNLLEPLKDLFKDEVRLLGKALSLNPRILKRHPFPGPGLAIRIIGEVTEERLHLLSQADKIFISQLKSTKVSRKDIKDKLVDSSLLDRYWYDVVSQAFTVFIPVKSVGVQGDHRTYEWTIILRAVVTTDFMTASCAKLPIHLLEDVSNQIINNVKGINRVAYDLSSKPPATIEWE